MRSFEKSKEVLQVPRRYLAQLQVLFQEMIFVGY